MLRFLLRPRWIGFHLLVAAAIALMANLGVWQLHRLDERRAFNATVIERSEGPAVPFDDVLADLRSGAVEPDGVEWRRVTLSGTYLPDQVIEFNNSQGGRAGDDVLTAIRTGGDATVIVNRGFVPLGTDLPAAPTGEVEVLGYVRPSESRERGSLSDAEGDGPLTEVRRIDVGLLARQLPGDVAPVYVQLVAARPEVGVGDPEPVTPPELGEGPHLSYAIQWFTFALAVGVGWALAVRRSVRQRRIDATGPLRPTGGDADEPAGTSARAERHGEPVVERVVERPPGTAPGDPRAGDGGHGGAGRPVAPAGGVSPARGGEAGADRR